MAKRSLVFQRYRVPYHDYSAEYRSIQPAIDKAVGRVLVSGRYRGGEETAVFESEFAEFCSAKYVITTGSCQDAIFRSLLALGVGKGDEVITVANIPIACTAPISHTEASFVWVDINERTYNIDVEQIEKALTPKTKAILVAHLYGHPADMDPIMEIAQQHGLYVIEDAATAVGARYKGGRVGTIGDVGCFSHAPSKILGNYGDGGTVVTNNSELAEKMRALFIYWNTAQHIDINGRSLHAGFCYRVEGYHSRMFELSTAILRAKLAKLETWIARRREIAQTYNELLKDLDVVTPFENSDVLHVYRNYTIRVKNRNAIRIKLAEKGVETGLQYAPPLHLQPVYTHLGVGIGSLPVTERVAQELINLPMYQELNGVQIEWVVRALHESLQEVKDSSRAGFM